MRALILLVLVLWGAAVPAAAQIRVPESEIDPGIFRIDEKSFLGTVLNPNLAFLDETGGTVQLGSQLGGKPLILVLSYYNCDGTCSVVNRDLKALLAQVTGWTPGKDFRVLTVSFDAKDTTETLDTFIHGLELPAEWRAGWRFLLSGPGDNARRLADSVGFKYFWSPRDRIFLHPGVFIFVAPDGKVVRYLYSLNTTPRDVTLALTDALAGKLTFGRLADVAAGLCYSYNYVQGRYIPDIPVLIGGGSLLLGMTTLAASLLVYRRKKGEFTS